METGKLEGDEVTWIVRSTFRERGAPVARGRSVRGSGNGDDADDDELSARICPRFRSSDVARGGNGGFKVDLIEAVYER